MASKTPSTKTLNRTIKALSADYREYCKAQVARAQATSERGRKAAQRTMDSLRPSYTEYRRAYNQLRKQAA